MKRAALISVSDKTGLGPFAQALVRHGYTLLATSGSGAFLSQEGIPFLSIEEYTNQREILGGRVKTLHPKIHAGLLAKRSDPAHLRQLEEEGILPIDVAVVNLYPFSQNLAGDTADFPEKMVELIDVGGPTMIRAAAKNFSGVLPVVDPNDYAEIAAHLGSSTDSVPLDLRRRLAVKVFAFTAGYDLAIARYFSNVAVNEGATLAAAKVDRESQFLGGGIAGVVLHKRQSLRYGENPHQWAGYYAEAGVEPSFVQLHGKELSYNNLLDFDAALRMVRGLPAAEPAVVIVKHLNPCGAAIGKDGFDALQKAKRGDPRSHFGGIIACNHQIDEESARDIASEFCEIVLAPDFSPKALEILTKSKNLRILRVNADADATVEIRSIAGGCLLQERERCVSDVRAATVATDRAPTEQEYADLAFAWSLSSHVKSNAILLVRDGMVVGTGAGQMSRIDAAEVAVAKAKTHGHVLVGAVAASDAFFPFPDTVEYLAANGISAIIAPSGAKRDREVVESCNAAGVALLFASDRHFRH